MHLFFRQIPHPITAGEAHINAKERERRKKSEKSEEEREQGTEDETSYLNPGN